MRGQPAQARAVAQAEQAERAEVMGMGMGMVLVMVMVMVIMVEAWGLPSDRALTRRGDASELMALLLLQLERLRTLARLAHLPPTEDVNRVALGDLQQQEQEQEQSVAAPQVHPVQRAAIRGAPRLSLQCLQRHQRLPLQLQRAAATVARPQQLLPHWRAQRRRQRL